jgi:hypothetical protein
VIESIERLELSDFAVRKQDELFGAGALVVGIPPAAAEEKPLSEF